MTPLSPAVNKKKEKAKKPTAVARMRGDLRSGAVEKAIGNKVDTDKAVADAPAVDHRDDKTTIPDVFLRASYERGANVWVKRLGFLGVCLVGLGSSLLYRDSLVDLYRELSWNTVAYGAIYFGLFLVAGSPMLLRSVFKKPTIPLNANGEEKMAVFEFVKLNDAYDVDQVTLHDTLRNNMEHESRTAGELPLAGSEGSWTPCLPKTVLAELQKQAMLIATANEEKSKNRAKAYEARVTDLFKAGATLEHVLSVLECDCLQPVCFVYDFNGDMMAGAVKTLRRFVDMVLLVARPTRKDAVVVKLTSPGGAVPHYGLAAAQLARLRGKVHLTVAVDIVAASGGYMMACVADRIVAAPFAFVGSIGVYAGLPNLHRLMDKNSLDYLEFTAGKYKRTVTMFSKVTDQGRAKLQDDLNAIHESFKQHVKAFRQQLDLDEIATGEVWLATEAKQKHLVDDLMTSDELIQRLMHTHIVLKVRRAKKPKGGVFKALCDMIGTSYKELMSIAASLRGIAKKLTLSALTAAPLGHQESLPAAGGDMIRSCVGMHTSATASAAAASVASISASELSSPSSPFCGESFASFPGAKSAGAAALAGSTFFNLLPVGEASLCADALRASPLGVDRLARVSLSALHPLHAHMVGGTMGMQRPYSGDGTVLGGLGSHLNTKCAQGEGEEDDLGVDDGGWSDDAVEDGSTDEEEASQVEASE